MDKNQGIIHSKYIRLTIIQRGDFLDKETPEEKQSYGCFRLEFAIAMVSIIGGGPLGVLLGLILLASLFIYKPNFMSTMSVSLFLLVIWGILAFLVFIIGIL